ncbi:MAG: hypothetical protein MHMPM18_001354 [Marteilia pararefringens]
MYNYTYRRSGLLVLKPWSQRVKKKRAKIAFPPNFDALKFKRIFPIDKPVFNNGALKNSDADSYNFFMPISTHCADPEARKIDLILLKDYGYVGNAGDTVSVTKKLAREVLLPQQIAMYNSPENIKWMALQKLVDESFKVKKLDVVRKRIYDRLMSTTVPIYLSPQAAETSAISKDCIRISLRVSGINCTNEDIVVDENYEKKDSAKFDLKIADDKYATLKCPLTICNKDTTEWMKKV